MALMNRETLKNFFKRGTFPTEVNFADFIDSTVNKVDDGFAKDMNDGLMLSPVGGSKKLLSFYNNVRDKNAAWTYVLNPGNRIKGLSIEEGGSNGKSRLFLKKGGNIGVGTTNPNYKFEIKGSLGVRSRIGTYDTGTVPADGKWHTILEEVERIQAFEVMAQVAGQPGRGRYALTHAIALSSFGKKGGKINQTRSAFGWFFFKFFHRISVRWKGGPDSFNLQIKTGNSYGTDESGNPRVIVWRLMKLWDERDEIILEEDMQDDNYQD